MRKFFILTGVFVLMVFFAPMGFCSTYLKELSGVRPFESMPIKIWVQDFAYQNAVYSAFGEWNRASGGCVKFKYATSESNAQIKVYFVKNLPNNTAGVTTSTYNSVNTHKAVVKIAVYPGNSKKPITKEQAFKVAVHEIGHAIGLFGHSSNRNDIMYPDTSLIGIYASGRDYETIRAVYCKR